MSCLDADTGLTPMSPFGIVSENEGFLVRIRRQQRREGERVLGQNRFVKQDESRERDNEKRTTETGLRRTDVPNRVSSPQSDPLGNRAILFLGFGKLLLRAEGFVGLFFGPVAMRR